MFAFLLILHLLICIALIAVVLVQSGKGGGLAGGAFGGSAQTVFGGRGATDFFTRATMILGGAFFVMSLVLSLMSSGVGTNRRSILQTEAAQRRAAPAAPAPGELPPAAPTQNAPATPTPATPAPPGGGR